ncbi:hypothetical protein ACFV42_23690 [Streptomyces solisilvae]|uniref:hypothetical protein n=1 Tax=Streptomyces malaysiensis TaxID=92644 RepID=UPI0036C79A6B
MRKHTVTLAAAVAALLTLTTPALADDSPASPAEHRGQALAWYNGSAHWGYLINPQEARCYTLDPAPTDGARIANFTPYQAMFYPGRGCFGITGPVIGPYDIAASVRSTARSVVLIPADATPLCPPPGPAPRR